MTTLQSDPPQALRDFTQVDLALAGNADACSCGEIATALRPAANAGCTRLYFTFYNVLTQFTQST